MVGPPGEGKTMLVAAMNPSPCGYFGSTKRECHCSYTQIQRYRTRVSGPLMDRIDIHMDVPAVEYRELSAKEQGKTSAEILEDLQKAREAQKERFRNLKIYNNAGMTGRHIRKFCQIDRDSDGLLETAMEKLGLSARAHSRILKIARTIADVEGSENITADHIAEAIQHRSLDRKIVK